MTNKSYHKGQVTAVIPVYNEERYLRETLDSVVNQADCVIIGDNASTDGTESICREYMEKYSHVQYFRNERNIGSIKNIILIYEKVTTEFVFHLGGHDLIPLGYVWELKQLLAADQLAICAFADAINFDLSGNEERLTFLNAARFLVDAQNPDPYFRGWSLVLYGFRWIPLYGLFRSEKFLPIAQKFQPIPNCDLAVLFEVILHGTFLYSSNTVYNRRDNHIEKTDNEYYDDAMKRVCGESDTSSLYQLNDVRPLAEQVLRTWEELNDEKYLASKEKFDFQLKKKFCKLTGERTGHFFVDIIIQAKHRWRNSGFREKWKAFVAHFKTNYLPFWAKKKKYRKGKDERTS